MDQKKERIIQNSVEDYKKLPKDKQMFVLGYMEGVLSNHSNHSEKEEAEVAGV